MTTSSTRTESTRLFDLARVRLGRGEFADAQSLDIEYLLGLDPDRLLAPFLIQAGLPPRGTAYGSWESQGLDGHMAGHYLSALSQMSAATGRDDLWVRAQYVVSELRRCQQAVGTGYVGGIPRSAALWAEVAAAEVDAFTFSRDARWVPLYNLHKVFAGLIDAYRHAHIPDALGVAGELADWWLTVSAALTDSQFETMLDTEYGGMNEVFADLAEITGRDDFLRMAHRFAHRALFEPLAHGRDELTGLHANTQIPKVIGYQRVATVSRDERSALAARWFWNLVVADRTVVIGGNSVREHFHDTADFSSMVEDREGPESCNTYNMIRLAAMLYEATGEDEFIEFIERALFNHVLSAQHPVHGGFAYFTPMRPGHYRKYSSREESFWCCVGTGLEAHARHGALIYARSGRTIIVNLFIESAVDWPERGLRLRQLTTFPDSPRTRLVVDAAPDEALTIAVRIPRWVAGTPTVRVGGETVPASRSEGRLEFTRVWSPGDMIDVSFSIATTQEQLPNTSGWAAILYGPIALASVVPDTALEYEAGPDRAGHVARGPLVPLVESPIAVLDETGRLDVAQTSSDSLEFIVRCFEGQLALVPFARIHDSRYRVYLPIANADGEVVRREQLRATDALAGGIDARTVDSVVFGEQQPEADHRVRADGSERGREGAVTWRRPGRELTLVMDDWQMRASVLRLVLLAGQTSFAVEVNGRQLWSTAEGGAASGTDRKTIELNIPGDPALRPSPQLFVAVRAEDALTAPRLHEIRLMSVAP